MATLKRETCNERKKEREQKRKKGGEEGKRKEGDDLGVGLPNVGVGFVLFLFLF